MLFHGHLLLGIVLFLAARLVLPLPAKIPVFLIVLLGALLPDIDEEHSKINQWSGIVGRVVGKLFPHRGVLHSVLFFVASSLVLGYFFGRMYGVALFIGYCAHVIGDGITPMGVMLFWPFKWKLRGPMKTGGFIEHMLTVALFALVIVLFLKLV